MGYTGKFDPETMARATGKEIPISPKHSVEICRAIRGLPITSAKNLLENVILKKEAIPFRRYNQMIPHRKRGAYSSRGGPGRYPVKAAKAILRVIESAQANAEKAIDDLGDAEDLRVLTAAASRGRVTRGWMPRAHGRWEKFDQESVNIEIVLEKMEE
ncbi:MAG: 50S ribosomal protein L22 [Candidatus Thermoplasmatota archaeon]|nr:50S ribosomal protein L22 [Euryarchaeota archaeon]MBU4031941.1 50S ribosomal protein L22 [Candidatus Thermoplasmatota archaeon]MBU4072483.1 50S ribosomal protein L22 [Candidatus Thermoplasmatota archaeon]MBU4144181.1 50S ribosomal protein L22 [Candidatus Thermoplasmatota archaeon]MBU4592815.1 50S ribosomal protein L22 [Candidatus Thermoplasmatota archaeon]